MNTGGLAQMSSNSFSHNGAGNPIGGLASRRGGPNIKPLSFDTIKAGADKENALPTPRTSRGHLLAGLRTAPKTSTATSFPPLSPTANAPSQQFARNNAAASINNQEAYNPPKTAFPQFNSQGQQSNGYQYVASQQQQQQQPQQQVQPQQQQHYTVDQVLAPPELPIDDQAQEQMDPNLYAQLVATNMYLAQQQQRLQQQLRQVQAAAQQFQQLNMSNPALAQQQMALYEQHQQLRNMQQQLGAQVAMSQGQQFYYNAATGQYYVDNSNAAQMASVYAEQPMTPGGFQTFQQQQYQQYQQPQQQQATPRVQVSPPPENQSNGLRSHSPPKRYESPTEVAPLPPPSANAFRRGHKKATSIAPINAALAATSLGDSAPGSAGPRTGTFPATPAATGGYGPGQGRAGEHPIRQPRGPPSLDELKLKPTSKHEGSKNFAARTRRSAVHNLVRAGLERRKGTGSSAGSMSPVSETAEESTTPITDNDSESGRSGSGSLAGEECAGTRKFGTGSWGAIGSNRPISSQKGRRSIDSDASDAENGSFANVFKNGASRVSRAQEATDDHRKPPRLVFTSAEKRKVNPMA